MTKRWWQSKTILGALAVLIATGVRALAPESELQEGEVLAFLTQAAQTIGALVAIVGRFKARTRVITKRTEAMLTIEQLKAEHAKMHGRDVHVTVDLPRADEPRA